LADPATAHDRLCELNVVEQVVNVCHTSIVRDAWERGQSLAVHGWIYGLRDGLLRDLGTSVAAPNEVDEAYRSSLQTLG
jgi:carbonic anhydrase